MPQGDAHPRWRDLPAALSVLTVLLMPLCGCRSLSTDDGMAGSYYRDPGKDLQEIGRVALMELDNRSGYPNTSTDMTEALYLAMQKQQLFGVLAVRRNDPSWRPPLENLDSFETLRELVALRETLRCNGLLTGTITEYQPYPHMVVGLRLKLLDLTDGRLLWAMEQVWDSADKSVQKRIKAYFKQERPSTSTALREELASVSFLGFAKFVAYEAARTLEAERQ